MSFKNLIRKHLMLFLMLVGVPFFTFLFFYNLKKEEKNTRETLNIILTVYENLSDLTIDKKVKILRDLVVTPKKLPKVPRSISETQYVLDSHGRIFSIVKDFESFKGFFLGREILYPLNSSIGKTVKYSIFTNKPYIPFVKELPGGYVYVAELNLGDLMDFAERVNIKRFRGKGFLVLLDQKGTVIFHPERRYILSRYNISWVMREWKRVRKGGFFVVNWGGEKRVVMSRKLRRTGWVACYVIPYPVILRDAFMRSGSASLPFLAFFILASMLFSLKVSKGLSTPLENLAKLIKEKGLKKDIFNQEVEGGIVELGVVVKALRIASETIEKHTRELETQLERIYKVFDGLDIFFCIVDARSYETVFANRYIRKALGENYRGKRCYSYFFGRSAPCPRCNMEDIRSGPKRKILKIRSMGSRIFDMVSQIVSIPPNRLWRVDIGIDITGEITTAKELLRKEIRFSKVIESMSEGLVVIDSNGNIEILNPSFSRLTGIHMDRIGEPWESVFVGELSTIGDHIKDIWDSEEDRLELFEVSIDSKIIECSLSKLFTNGEFFLLLVFRDITQKRLLEERMFHRQRLETMGTILEGISHDFNNLLTVIAGAFELLSSNYKNVEDSPVFKKALHALETASSYVRSILSFAESPDDRAEELDLGKVVEETVTLFRRFIPDHIEVRTKIEQDIPVVAVKSHVVQAIANLILNARDALEGVKNPIIEVKAFKKKISSQEAQEMGIREGIYGVVSVRDNGRGIPKELRDRIFDPFFTSKPRSTEKGTGLGLYIVYKVVESYGGTITFDTEEGKGTEFRIFLPLASEHKEKHTFLALKESLKVLAISSQEDYQKILTTLKRVGYHVKRADPEEIEEVLSKEKFDVILLDENLQNREEVQKLLDRLSAPARILVLGKEIKKPITPASILEGIEEL